MQPEAAKRLLDALRAIRRIREFSAGFDFEIEGGNLKAKNRESPSCFMNPPRIFLSPPHMGKDEFEFVREAFATNWIAPVGPHVEAFETEFAAAVGSPHAVAGFVRSIDTAHRSAS